MHNLVTFVGRVTDSMILVATMDNDEELESYERHAVQILKSLKTTSPSKCTIEAGNYYYHYIIESNVCYMALAERYYPKRLAFQYLEELCREFTRSHGPDIHTFSRPYQAINFDPKMNKLRKEYLDPQAPKNVQKLSQDLSDIHNIMHQNIQEILKRGESLERVATKGSVLLQESKRFDKNARYLNLQALYRTIGPLLALLLVILFVVYMKFIR